MRIVFFWGATPMMLVWNTTLALAPDIQRDFNGLDFELLNVAVSDHEGRATFHIAANDDISFLEASASLNWGDIRGTVEVQVMRLGPILADRSVPFDFDLLSLDIEGEDIKVFRDLLLSTPYRPRCVIIEASNDCQTNSVSELDLRDLIGSAYQLVEQTPANLILCHSPSSSC